MINNYWNNNVEQYEGYEWPFAQKIVGKIKKKNIIEHLERTNQAYLIMSNGILLLYNSTEMESQKRPKALKLKRNIYNSNAED